MVLFGLFMVGIDQGLSQVRIYDIEKRAACPHCSKILRGQATNIWGTVNKIPIWGTEPKIGNYRGGSLSMTHVKFAPWVVDFGLGYVGNGLKCS